MEDWDDSQLMERILAGDNAAFDILVERYRRAVFSWVRQRLPDVQYDQDLLLKFIAASIPWTNPTGSGDG